MPLRLDYQDRPRLGVNRLNDLAGGQDSSACRVRKVSIAGKCVTERKTQHDSAVFRRTARDLVSSHAATQEGESAKAQRKKTGLIRQRNRNSDVTATSSIQARGVLKKELTGHLRTKADFTQSRGLPSTIRGRNELKEFWLDLHHHLPTKKRSYPP
jgi:hypothetical protein